MVAGVAERMAKEGSPTAGWYGRLRAWGNLA